MELCLEWEKPFFCCGWVDSGGPFEELRQKVVFPAIKILQHAKRGEQLMDSNVYDYIVRLCYRFNLTCIENR